MGEEQTKAERTETVLCNAGISTYGATPDGLMVPEDGAEYIHADDCAALITQVIAHLKAAKVKNDQVQGKQVPGSNVWHLTEDTDDQIHLALCALGD